MENDTENDAHIGGETNEESPDDHGNGNLDQAVSADTQGSISGGMASPGPVSKGPGSEIPPIHGSVIPTVASWTPVPRGPAPKGLVAPPSTPQTMVSQSPISRAPVSQSPASPSGRPQKKVCSNCSSDQFVSSFSSTNSDLCANCYAYQKSKGKPRPIELEQARLRRKAKSAGLRLYEGNTTSSMAQTATTTAPATESGEPNGGSIASSFAAGAHARLSARDVHRFSNDDDEQVKKKRIQREESSLGITHEGATKHQVSKNASVAAGADAGAPTSGVHRASHNDRERIVERIITREALPSKSATRGGLQKANNGSPATNIHTGTAKVKAVSSAANANSGPATASTGPNPGVWKVTRRKHSPEHPGSTPPNANYTAIPNVSATPGSMLDITSVRELYQFLHSDLRIAKNSRPDGYNPKTYDNLAARIDVLTHNIHGAKLTGYLAEEEKIQKYDISWQIKERLLRQNTDKCLTEGDWREEVV